MNDRIKVLHIIGTPGLGGVQTYILDISRYDKEYGISRSLLCLHGNEGELKNKFLENNVDCIECNIMPKDHMLQPYRLWKIFRKYLPFFFLINLFVKIKNIKPDIIVGDEPNRLNQQLIVSGLLKIPYVWHIHNENQFININKQIFKLLFGSYLKTNLHIVSDSKFILNKNFANYKSIIKDKWDDIPIQAAMSNLEPIFNYKVKNHNKPNSQIQIGSIGRLAPVKNYQWLIKIIAIIKNEYNKNIHLSIAGSGEMYGILNDIIEQHKIESCVSLLGNVNREDIPEFLSTLDIYVQSSLSEGSPLTIKEAMAASLPIISTNVGGISELIIDGETGVLVEPNNQIEFIDALNKLINLDIKERSKMGENAFIYAKKNYSIESLADKNRNIYQSLCAK